MFRNVLFTLTGLLLITPAAASAEPPADAGTVPPWLAPETAGEYLLFQVPAPIQDRSVMRAIRVLHVPTRQFVTDDWRARLGSSRTQRVKGTTEHLWLFDHLLDMREERLVRTPQVERNTHFFADDHRRVMYYENGDIWRAEMDWRTGEFVNRKQVTQLGLFRTPLAPIVWYGNDVYLEAGFDREKPIVRLNLASGEITEMEKPVAFGGYRATNPPGWLLVRHETGFFDVLDVRTGQTRRMTNPGVPRNAVRDLQWLDDTTAVASIEAGIFRFDFETGRVQNLTHSERRSTWYESRSLDGTVLRPRILQIIPGDQWASIAGRIPVEGTPPGHLPEALFRMNLSTGAVEQLHIEGDSPPITHRGVDGTWLDERYFVFSRTEGGLARIGTWLHDHKTRETRRFVQQPSIHWILLPEAGAVVFHTHQSQHLVNLDGTELMELPGRYARIDPDPIDLGFADSDRDVWAEPVRDVAVAEPEAPAPTRAPVAAQPASPPIAPSEPTERVHMPAPPAETDDALTEAAMGDELRLEQAIEGMSEVDQELVRTAFYQWHSDEILNTHFDRVSFALLVRTEVRRLQLDPRTPWNELRRHLLEHGNLSEALSREQMVVSISARVERHPGTRDRPDLPVLAGEIYADRVMAGRIPTAGRTMRIMLSDALRDARRAEGAGELPPPPEFAPEQPASPPTAPPAPTVPASPAEADDALPEAAMSDELRLELAIEGMSDADQKLVRSAFEAWSGDQVFSHHYSRIEFALAVRDETRRLGLDAGMLWPLLIQRVRRDGDLSAALSRERMVSYITGRTRSMVRDPERLDLPELVGERYADKIMADPSLVPASSRIMNTMFTETLREIRSADRAGELPPAPEVTPAPVFVGIPIPAATVSPIRPIDAPEFVDHVADLETAIADLPEHEKQWPRLILESTLRTDRRSIYEDPVAYTMDAYRTLKEALPKLNDGDREIVKHALNEIGRSRDYDPVSYAVAFRNAYRQALHEGAPHRAQRLIQDALPAHALSRERIVARQAFSTQASDRKPRGMDLWAEEHYRLLGEIYADYMIAAAIAGERSRPGHWFSETHRRITAAIKAGEPLPTPEYITATAPADPPAPAVASQPPPAPPAPPALNAEKVIEYDGMRITFSGGPDDITELKSAAEAGNTRACLLLGELAGQGQIDGGAAEAVRWFEKGHKLGDAECTARLALHLLMGRGVDEDDPRRGQRNVRHLAHTAANGNSALGLYLYAECIAKGIGAEASPEAAVEFYQRAAALGNPLARRWCDDNDVSY